MKLGLIGGTQIDVQLLLTMETTADCFCWLQTLINAKLGTVAQILTWGKAQNNTENTSCKTLKNLLRIIYDTD